MNEAGRCPQDLGWMASGLTCGTQDWRLWRWQPSRSGPKLLGGDIIRIMAWLVVGSLRNAPARPIHIHIHHIF